AAISSAAACSGCRGSSSTCWSCSRIGASGAIAGVCSRIEIGDQLALEPGNVVLEQELALLEPGQLQLVAPDRMGELIDRRVEIAMLQPQLGEHVDDFGVILNLHGDGGVGMIAKFSAVFRSGIGGSATGICKDPGPPYGDRGSKLKSPTASCRRPWLA